MVVTSQWLGTSKSPAIPARSNARNCRAERPSACACSVMWATAWPRSYNENSEYSRSVPSTHRCDRLATSKLAAGAQTAELPARWRTSRRCGASPRHPTINAHGCELPADGAHRAASSRESTVEVGTSWSGSNLVGLHRDASRGCTSSLLSTASTLAKLPSPARAAAYRRAEQSGRLEWDGSLS